MVYGEVDDVRREHSTPGVVVAMASEPPRVDGVEEVRSRGNSDWLLLLDEGVRPTDVLAALVRTGAEVERFEPVLAPMEEIFIKVVREGRA
jgi:ABC-type uncharacterized transport system ATPase subunit